MPEQRRQIGRIATSLRHAVHSPRLRPARALAACGVALAALGGAEPAAAQGGPGFLFRAPAATFTVRGGYDRALAGSDIFAQSTRELTLDRGDFSSPTVAFDLAVALQPNLDIVVGTSFSKVMTRSEYREFVGSDDLPIEQTTTFRRVPITVGVRAYLAPRGQSIGRFAWVPSRFVPFVGGGLGAMRHKFEQSGEFLDPEESLDVFRDNYISAGWSRTAHALAGFEFSVSPHLALTGEGRYTWANATMSDDFSRFDRIDLSGLAATAGIAVRF
jgi:opacity protein-like surface antigen